MNVLILGLGISGKAAASYFNGQVYVLDDHSEHLKKDPDIQRLMKNGLTFVQELPEGIEQIIASPGVPATHWALQRGIPVIGEVELAARRLQGYPWVGVTGTNGKTTVTLFLDHLFKTASRRSAALGNVGTPLLTHEPQEDEVIIAELSSYQLDLMQTAVLEAALLLNITPDHLDRYQTLEAYAASKVHIFDCLKPEGVAVVSQKTVAAWPALFQGRSFITFGFEKEADISCDGSGVVAFGKKVAILPKIYQDSCSHDVENWMAAYAVARAFHISDELFLKALTSFEKPHHRLEKVADCQGVLFVDDSKGTNIDAVCRAVEAMKGPVHLIAGGVHKGFSYTAWKKPFAGKVKALYTIGESAAMIQKDLQDSFPIVHCQSMEDAVNRAAVKARAGETVLLSPGCSSFDMFKDYAHRGEEFQRCVRNWMRTNT